MNTFNIFLTLAVYKTERGKNAHQTISKVSGVLNFAHIISNVISWPFQPLCLQDNFHCYFMQTHILQHIDQYLLIGYNLWCQFFLKTRSVRGLEIFWVWKSVKVLSFIDFSEFLNSVFMINKILKFLTGNNFLKIS
jgi:hypothetical protein